MMEMLKKYWKKLFPDLIGEYYESTKHGALPSYPAIHIETGTITELHFINNYTDYYNEFINDYSEQNGFVIDSEGKLFQWKKHQKNFCYLYLKYERLTIQEINQIINNCLIDGFSQNSYFEDFDSLAKVIKEHGYLSAEKSPEKLILKLIS